MMRFHWLHSPLAGTAGVLMTLGLLAIPLRHLTSHPPARMAATDTSTPSSSKSNTHSLLRLKLLTPARSIRVKTEDSSILLDLTNVPPGESEHDAYLPILDHHLDLLLDADLGTSPSDTAVFLTVMPDGHDDQTRYSIGSGTLTEPLSYDWHEH